MKFIILETAAIGVSVLQDHLALVPLIVLPDALEKGSIRPGHLAVAVALASLEVALVLGLFVVTLSCAAWQTIIVLHDAIAIGPAVLKGSPELVTILVVDLGQPIVLNTQTNICKSVSCWTDRLTSRGGR